MTIRTANGTRAMASPFAQAFQHFIRCQIGTRIEVGAQHIQDETDPENIRIGNQGIVSYRTEQRHGREDHHPAIKRRLAVESNQTAAASTQQADHDHQARDGESAEIGGVWGMAGRQQ